MPIAMNLYSADKGGVFQVTKLPNVGLLENIGLRKGTKVSVEHRYALGGPVLLNIEDSFSVAVGKDIATQITVGSMPNHELP